MINNNGWKRDHVNKWLKPWWCLKVHWTIKHAKTWLDAGTGGTKTMSNRKRGKHIHYLNGYWYDCNKMYNMQLISKNCEVPAKSGCVRVIFNQSIWLKPFSNGTFFRAIAFFVMTFSSWEPLKKSPASPRSKHSTTLSFGGGLSMTLKVKESSIPGTLGVELPDELYFCNEDGLSSIVMFLMLEMIFGDSKLFPSPWKPT